MSLSSLIENHGYWLLALGCLLEGETILLMAGFAAHRGYLDPLAVFVIAAVCGFAGDQFWFWLGRRHGAAALARWPSLGRQSQRLHQGLERYQSWFIVGVRFAYGLRVAGPLWLGSMPISWTRFTLFNALGALVWAALIGGLGWFFGEAAQAMLGRMQHAEGWLLAGLGMAGAAWWLLRRRARQ